MYMIRERLFRLADDSDITDEKGHPVLHVDGTILSLRDRLILRDPSGARGRPGCQPDGDDRRPGR